MRTASNSEIIVQFVVVDLGGTSLRVGDQFLGGFSLTQASSMSAQH
jgi:hexokinase